MQKNYENLEYEQFGSVQNSQMYELSLPEHGFVLGNILLLFYECCCSVSPFLIYAAFKKYLCSATEVI